MKLDLQTKPNLEQENQRQLLERSDLAVNG